MTQYMELKKEVVTLLGSRCSYCDGAWDWEVFKVVKKIGRDVDESLSLMKDALFEIKGRQMRWGLLCKSCVKAKSLAEKAEAGVDRKAQRMKEKGLF